MYREGHGAVVWDRPVDLSAASGERSVRDVFSLSKDPNPRVVVYPDEHNKPAEGEGLNVPATIYFEMPPPDDVPEEECEEPPRWERSGGA